MEPAEEKSTDNRDSDLEAFQGKILAKCQVRSGSVQEGAIF